MSEEDVFYSDESGVRVTSTRFMVGSTTYPFTGITSIETTKIPAKRSSAIWTIIIGALVAISGLRIESIIGFIGVAVLAVGVIWLFTIKDTYVLRITTAAGQTDAVKNKGDPNYIQNIARALNDAIIQRG